MEKNVYFRKLSLNLMCTEWIVIELYSLAYIAFIASILSRRVCVVCVYKCIFICVLIANEYFISILNCFVIYIWFNRNNQNQFALSLSVSLPFSHLWVSQVLNYSTECFACDTINNGWSKLSKSFTLLSLSTSQKSGEEEKNSPVQHWISDF